MNRPKNLKDLKLPLHSAGFSDREIEDWYQIQDNYLLNEFFFQEYQSTSKNYLSPIVLKDLEERFKEGLIDRLYRLNFKINEEVRFKDLNIDWSELSEISKINGFFIPTSVIREIKQEDLNPQLYFLHQLTKRFDFASYIKFIIKNSIDGKNLLQTLYSLLIKFLEAYQNSLKELYEKEPLAFTGIKGLKLFFDQSTITRQSPINESIFYLIYLVERDFFKNIRRDEFWKKRLTKNQDIRAVDRLWDDLIDVKKKWINIGRYYDEIQVDKKEAVAEFIYSSRKRFMYYSLETDMKVIEERIEGRGTNKAGFFNRKTDQVAKVQNSLFHLSGEVKPTILYALNDDFNSSFSIFIDKALKRSFRKDWLIKFEKEDHGSHLTQVIEILNQLCAPWFQIQYKNGNLMPFMQALSSSEFNQAISSHQLKEELRKKQHIYLQYLMNRITSVYSMEDLEREFKAFQFSFPELQNTWFSVYQAAKRSLKVRIKFRSEKMLEFGILSSNIQGGFGKEIWLDELLKIEEEVAEYVVFVKDAFAQALPIQRKTKFNEFRRTVDGVEVDPEVFYNPDRYLRAEVMKPMTTVIDEKPIHQLNTFCLDYSGSMTQERMRNLFKMLYLLVLGLDDKVSYDAFHFFSNNFIPGVDFSADSTNKKMLFEILTSIAQIEHGQVKYSGKGATNLSDGITKCYESLKEFNKKLLKEYPDIYIVKSMFVISDGEPSLGIIDRQQLKNLVENMRQEIDISINGLYIYPEDEATDYMTEIFGEKHAIEADDFGQAVTGLVNLMTREYKQQRIDYKWKLKAQKLANHD